MFAKSLEEVKKYIENYPKEDCLILVVYGKDVSLVDFILEYIEKKIFKNISYELITLTGEVEDFNQIVNEIYNFSLFSQNRIYVVRQGKLIFKNFKFKIRSLPPKTWLIIEYEDTFPFQLIQIEDNKILYLETKIIYENQIEFFLQNLAKQYHLILSEEALNEIKMLFPPKESILRTAIYNLHRNIERDLQKTFYVNYEEVRNVFYPIGGWDVFKIIDACFKKDIQTFLVEIEKFNPPEDNHFSLLKNLLNKTDELRKYIIGKKMNMNSEELLQITQIHKKPFIIQKKILKDLEYYSNLFSLEKINKIYNLILEFSFAFRQIIEDHNKKTIFTKKAIEVFFS